MEGDNNNKLNETEIICPSELSLDEKFIYNDPMEKSLQESKYSSQNKSNILLNVLKDFSVRYDLDDRRIMKHKKFILSFEDLISLIKFALEFQIRINNSLNLKDYLNEISQDFINNLSYYIFSYEKIDMNQYNNININNNYNTYNTNLNNKNYKNIINAKKFPLNTNQEDKKRKQEEQIYFFSPNIKEKIQDKKSYYKQNNNIVISPKNINKNKDKKIEEIKNKKRLNRSHIKRKNVYIEDFENNTLFEEENNRKQKLNKSTEKRKNLKNDTIFENKNRNSLSIYKACENIKGSRLILKCTKSRRLSGVDIKDNKNISNYNSINMKKYDKTVYYDKNLNIGVKKKIISNNIIRPSNMANKLLQRGMKYITDFKDLKEEENKKKYKY